MKIRTYEEMCRFRTFSERLEYLRMQIPQCIGSATFGPDRGLNQLLYKSPEWAQLRNYVIARDEGCDLGISSLPIKRGAVVHHMNPITKEDILNRTAFVFDPNYLITVSRKTHEMIHYGLKPEEWHEREPNDTIPWR